MRLRGTSVCTAVIVVVFSLLTGCGKGSNENTSATTSQPASSSSSSPGLMDRLTSKPVTLPAGTVLTVRLGETLSSKSSQAGQSFAATVAQPVQVDGKTVIPDGASARGTVVDAKPLGHFKGGALLRVRLTSVTINGSDVNVQTAAVARSLQGKGKRSATMIGGGAGLGALIGGLAGGGKGAAIGAVAGGGAGTAGAAFTGNKDVVLPAESALSFKLVQPVEIKK